MSEFDELFKQAVNISRKNKGKFTLTVGTVKAVENDTCTVDNYEDVRLNSIVESLNSQFTVYPKIGSKVVIGRLENEDNAFVIGVSEIEKVIIKIGDQLFEFKNGNVTIKMDNLLFEMKAGKFTIQNESVNLKSILNDGFEQLGKAIIMTPSGPGKFSAADKLVFEDLKEKTNQLLD
jgi:beta-mannanase